MCNFIAAHYNSAIWLNLRHSVRLDGPRVWPSGNRWIQTFSASAAYDFSDCVIMSRCLACQPVE